MAEQRLTAWVLPAITVVLTLAAFAANIATRDVVVTVYGLRPQGLVGIAFAAVGGLVASRRRNRVGTILSLIGFAIAVSYALQEYVIYGAVAQRASLPLVAPLSSAFEWAWVFIIFSAAQLLLLFPSGRYLSPRWRLVPVLLVVGATAMVAGGWRLAGSLSNLEQVTNPFGAPRSSLEETLEAAGGLLFAIGMLLSGVGVIVRVRRARGDERQQLRWFAIAGLIVGASIGLLSILPLEVVQVVQVAALGFLPIATGIAIFKHRLYDIDVVINRALVFGALAVFITVIYVVIVVGVASLIGRGGEPNLVLSIAATALVAVVFEPVRARVQRIANRLVYGRRATPYEAMTQLSDRVANSLSLEEVLPRMAEVAATGVGAAAARVTLRLAERGDVAVTWPADAAFTAHEDVEVRHRGEVVGSIAVAMPPGESLAPAEQRLLSDLAAQAGLALRNAALTVELRARLDQIEEQAEELRASRLRIVAAQDAERRRMERDIHDGAQQHLVALAVKLGLAKTMAQRDADKAKELLTQIQADTQEAVETLRSLARGIYPPVLAEQGVAAALSAHVQRAGFPVTIDAASLGRLPEDVETALFFTCVVALQNAA